MDKELLFITVLGQDKKGIVARISGLLYESGVNIEDISQGIMEGYFVMTMAVDMREANRDLESLGPRRCKRWATRWGCASRSSTRTCSR